MDADEFLLGIPLAQNGKVNSRELPKPEGRRRIAAPFTPPRSETEQIIADIWQLLLGRDEVGIDDNFFELGGHSLLATQVVARLRERFSVEVPVRKVFEEATVRGLAREIGVAAAAMPQLRRVERGVAGVEASFAQQRLWF
ncbi:phosphopantetheine-binding protein, partial [Streptomyces sp. GbtcB6]|uniref:phosphopantetheine-binding protein n=1 Tax=Streptomyces sp. GbtcB6 TaxID=2824751 RepID=UPI0020C5CB8A